LRVRLRHVVHSLTVLVVATLLVFAGLFLGDLARTGTTYNNLVAHHVAVTGRLFRCFNVTGEPEKFFYDNCYVNYSYQHQEFHAWTDKSWGVVFYVDPENTSYRMNKTIYDNAQENIDSDVVFAVLLLSGALLVTVGHLVYLNRLRRRNRLLHHPDRFWQNDSHGHVPVEHQIPVMSKQT
jgi:hypothetical protein